MYAFIRDSIKNYKAALREHSAEILDEIANHTDIASVVQSSEVVVERSNS